LPHSEDCTFCVKRIFFSYAHWIQSAKNIDMRLLNHFLTKLHKQPKSYVKKKQFRFGPVLGTGSCGEVKQATVIATGQEVAIKIIRKSEVKNHQHIVNAELSTVGNMNHPNIVKLLDWFESREKYYIVFELAKGGELFKHLRERGPYPEHDAAKLVRVILDAVDYMHKHHVVHRDLKLENLLYKSTSKDAPLLIADFGIAHLIDSPDQLMSAVCGTRGYTAPEILLHRQYDSKIDIWSVGVITYMLLCGHPPFVTDDQEAMLRMIQSEQLRFHPRYWNHISQEAKDFVRALLRADPANRPTAEAALKLPWLMKFADVSAHSDNTTVDFPNIHEGFDARRQLRKGIYAVRIMHRMRHLAQFRRNSSVSAATPATSDDSSSIA
jgi:calcium/calmodulin-dependent protein kinase I